MNSRARRSRRRRPWIVAALVMLALLLWCGWRRPLVLGTFNIQTFPHRGTDFAAVAAALAELDADAVAVQEIGDPAAFDRVLERASALTGRRYRAELVASCRGRANGRLNVGVVYDAARLELVAARPLGSGDSCPEGQPPGLVALLRESDGRATAVASVHFQPGGSAKQFEQRKRQWTWLTSILPGLSAELGAPIVVAGDVNSTGFLERASEERRFIDDLMERRGLALPTGSLGCSMYWQPKRGHPYVPSLLDHVVVPEDMSFGEPEALGMCAELRCASQQAIPPGFRTISDHCPVRVELRR